MSEGASKVENMTAQALPARSLWTPDPVRQRLADYTIEDVLALPEDAPRVELRDGVLIVVPSPSFGHQTLGYLVWNWLRNNAPAAFQAGGAQGVIISPKNSLEPDAVLLRAPVDGRQHHFPPEQVELAVEVVSPGTKRRDRLEKPVAYAAAGVRHFWRIEQEPVHVYAYKLGPNGAYTLVADSDTELVLDSPFEIRLLIKDITP